MKDKMTSGEIAKKAGISQKAVRLYDEKGLLKPSDYSEGNYRLYDNEALLVLEKIIALKQVGFSLEEIRDSLTGKDNTDILKTLEDQIEMMETKRYELERAVARIKAVIARSNGNPDWDDVADILKEMQADQNADDGHFFALDHTKDEIDWYVKIFNDIKVKPGEKVLDLGCGFAKLWRNNWEEIPEFVKIDGYDLRGSWADDFEKFVNDNSDKLSNETKINVWFEDLEDEKTWEHIKGEEKYSMIIAHYLADGLKDAEALIAKSSEVLADNGVMSLNCYGNGHETRIKFWIDKLEELGFDTKALKEEAETDKALKAQCKEYLCKYFPKVEEIVIPTQFTYENAEDMIKDLECCLEGHKSFLECNSERISDALSKTLSDGPVKIPHDGYFWRLSK